MKTVRPQKPSFLAAKDGNVGMLFAMMIVPVTILAGGTVDYGRVLSQKARVQAASDAAALAAARPMEATEGERAEIAKKVFQANIAQGGTRPFDPVVRLSAATVTVEANVMVPTPFLSLASITSMPAKGIGTAVAGSKIEEVDPGKICLLALDPNSDDGIHLQGDNQVNYTGCWAHTNSSKTTAINANGSNARAIGKGNCAVGSFSQTHDTFAPEPKSGCKVVPDPFAVVGAYVEGGTYQPTFSKPYKATTCKASNLNLKKGVFTLDSGRYCGGINIQAGATVTFNAGIYYIDNGLFNVQSGSSVRGTNVLFYLAGANARMQVIGGGATDLSGRHESASYAGFLVIADADANRGGESNIQGGGIFKLNGTIYMPTQRIEVSGQGDVNAQAVNTFGMIAKDFYFLGNGIFNTVRHTGQGKVPDIMPTMPVESIRETVLN